MTEDNGNKPNRHRGRMLKAGAGIGRNVRLKVDRDALRAIFNEPSESIIEEVLDKLVVLMFEQDRREVVDLRPLAGGDSKDLRNKINKVEKAAKKLRIEIEALNETKEGKLHFGRWLLGYSRFTTGVYSAYPDSLFVRMLANLSTTVERNYRPTTADDQRHLFIREVEKLFDEYDIEVENSDNSIFSKTLMEIERQFPQLAFPSGLMGTGKYSDSRSLEMKITRARAGQS